MILQCHKEKDYKIVNELKDELNKELSAEMKSLCVMLERVIRTESGEIGVELC